ncbi:ABC transporter substrate-binding protein [Endozoicomonas sp.]|uniref:ABC transporter substrate-binding protein n=1 Tax=Endozoicomonas sp. TaxID=1892382 RepID=UPI003AF6084B
MTTPRWIRKLCSSLAFAITSTQAIAADQVTFQLDWLPGGDKAPVYVGIHEGFFAEQDIAVNIAQGRGSTDAISKLATGTADIGQADLVALMMAKANDQVPVTAVYSVFSEAPHAFFVLKDSGIDSAKDVAGKTIATSPFTSSNIFLPLLLDLNNVEEESINLVKANPGALNPMLMTGSTDLVISWLTDTERYRQQARDAGKDLEVLPWYDAGLEFYSTALVASDRFLAERPDVARRFIKAFAKAIDYTWKNPEASGVAINKQVPEVDVQVAADTIKAIKGLVYNDASASHGLGKFDPERLATTWSWTARAQQLDIASFNPASAVTPDSLNGE